MISTYVYLGINYFWVYIFCGFKFVSLYDISSLFWYKILFMHSINDLLANNIQVTFLNKPELICWHTVKWYQVLLSYTNGFK